jgi:molybdopterin-binding protein
MAADGTRSSGYMERSGDRSGSMMKLSARNQIKGKVTSVEKGQTTGHVHIDIGGGITMHCSITNEAIDELALAVGDDAWAVIKASDVMVAK